MCPAECLEVASKSSQCPELPCMCSGNFSWRPTGVNGTLHALQEEGSSAEAVALWRRSDQTWWTSGTMSRVGRWRQRTCRQAPITWLHGGAASAARSVGNHMSGRQGSSIVPKLRAPIAQSAAERKSAPASRLHYCGLILCWNGLRKTPWIREPWGASAHRKHCGHAEEILSMAPGQLLLRTERGPMPQDALHVGMKQSADPGMYEGF